MKKARLSPMVASGMLALRALFLDPRVPPVLGTALLFALLSTPPAAGTRMHESQIQYLGYFTPPSDNAWAYSEHGLTLIPDCLGQTDPSPADGYPGCIGGFAASYQFGVFDIVPPGQQAVQVVPFYELGAPIAEEQIGRSQSKYWDVLYDKGPGYCRLWWTYGTWYTSIDQDPPFLGLSDCTPAQPNPQGLWDFGEEDAYSSIKDDPFHTAKMYRGLSLIPQPLADNHFDGKQMMMGISWGNGGRGGSQGPSLYVRPLQPPPPPAQGPVMDATPMVWYRTVGYMEWWLQPEMDGPLVHYWVTSKARNAEFLRAGGSEAVVLPWREPAINPLDYPCSHPTAYRDSDPTTPDPCEVPVCWYGINACAAGPPDGHQPSFWETSSTGAQQPKDCNISSPCGQYTGPHCLSVRPFLILYDVEELAEVYRGEQPRNYPQPYAKISLEQIFIGGQCNVASTGTAYDPTNQLYFVGQSGGSPAVHVFLIGSPSGFEDDFETGDTSKWPLTIP